MASYRIMLPFFFVSFCLLKSALSMPPLHLKEGEDDLNELDYGDIPGNEYDLVDDEDYFIYDEEIPEEDEDTNLMGDDLNSKKDEFENEIGDEVEDDDFLEDDEVKGVEEEEDDEDSGLEDKEIVKFNNDDEFLDAEVKKELPGFDTDDKSEEELDSEEPEDSYHDAHDDDDEDSYHDVHDDDDEDSHHHVHDDDDEDSYHDVHDDDDEEKPSILKRIYRKFKMFWSNMG